MIQVDFYVLTDSDPLARLGFACRLAEKAWRLGHRVFLHTSDQTTAQHLDQLLWQFRSDAFVPHRMHPVDGPEATVLIGWGDEPPADQTEVLINLALTVPLFCNRFQRISEVVTNEPSVRQATRQHWRQYQEWGYPLKKHDIPS